MFANKNYKRDINYTVELSRFIFRLLGAWPYARTKSCFQETIERVVIILVSYILFIFELIPTVFYMVMQKETRARLKVASSEIYTIMTLTMYSLLLFSRDRVRRCLAQVDDDWRNVADSRDRNIMIDKTRTSRNLLLICAIFMYTTGVSFRTIIPLSRGKIVTAQNITIRHLPLPSHFVLFDVQLSPAYEIVFLMQFLSGIVKCTVSTAVCGFAGLCVMHICAQLEILMVLMKKLVNKHELKNVNKRLAIIVKHQVKTQNFLQLVQNTTQYISLLEITVCTIIVCLIGYFIIMEWENNNVVAVCTYLIGITSIMFNIFIFCFIGEQLSTKGKEVALTACTLKWYRLPDAKTRSLILIMMMSNSPTKLSGGKFIELSFRTFGHVVKTALTYLNLLRSVVD